MHYKGNNSVQTNGWQFEQCCVPSIPWLGPAQKYLCRSSKLEGAGIAQWLERRTRDWKVAGSNPCWNGGRIFFSRVDFLCWLLFRYPFHPRVTAVARKKSRSFCQKCGWQVTAKHAYTLRIEPCFGIGHNLSLICQMTSEDIKHQLNNNNIKAGICGSMIFFDFFFLKEWSISLAPSLEPDQPTQTEKKGNWSQNILFCRIFVGNGRWVEFWLHSWLLTDKFLEKLRKSVVLFSPFFFIFVVGFLLLAWHHVVRVLKFAWECRELRNKVWMVFRALIWFLFFLFF